MTKEEVAQTPASVHKKVLHYFWESQKKFDADEEAIRRLQQ